MGTLIIAGVMVGGIAGAADRSPSIRHRLGHGLGAGLAVVGILLACVAFGGA